MDLFYLIVVGVAVSLLIIILTYIGLQMRSTENASDLGFPPVKQTCPDKWEAAMGGDKQTLCLIPDYKQNSMKNVGTLYSADGTISTAIMNATPGMQMPDRKSAIDFNDAGWSTFGLTSDCKKKEWANTYNVVWDGISNYNKC